MGENAIDQELHHSNNVLEHLATIIKLRCVECASLYPGISTQPRYRCECGGVLDVEAEVRYPIPHEPAIQNEARASTISENDVSLIRHTQWQRLFNERASQSLMRPSRSEKHLLDSSGVWRYRELIL